MGFHANYSLIVISFIKSTILLLLNCVFKSFDGGNIWNSFSISEFRFFNIYFVTSNLGFAACESGKIAKTTNGGENWSLLYQSSSNSEIKKIQFLNDQVGYAIQFDQVFKTMNGGVSWSTVLDMGESINAIHFLTPEVGFIAGRYGITKKTLNGGKYWNDISFSGFIDHHDMYSIFFINDTVGICSGLRGRTMRTEDGGQIGKLFLKIMRTFMILRLPQMRLDISQQVHNYLKLPIKEITGYYKINMVEKKISFINDTFGYGIGSSRSINLTTNGGESWINKDVDNLFHGDRFRNTNKKKS